MYAVFRTHAQFSQPTQALHRILPSLSPKPDGRRTEEKGKKFEDIPDISDIRRWF